jgi:hypothetical protein
VECVTHTGQRRGACRIFSGKQEGKKPLWRPMQIKVFNIKMEFPKVGGVYGLNWCGSGQAQLAGVVVRTVMKLQVLYNTGNLLAGCGTVRFSGWI